MAGGPVRSGISEKRQIRLGIVSDAVGVVGTGAEPSIATPAIIRSAPSLVRMIGVSKSATLEIRRQRVSRERVSSQIFVAKIRLPALRSRQPAQEMIE